MSYKDPNNAIPSDPPHDYDKQNSFLVKDPQLDSELDSIERALDETQDRLDLIQRADGALENESVHPEALSPAATNFVEQTALDIIEPLVADTVAARNKAEQWAENPEDTQVETGRYSALHHAAKAAISASAAATSESDAAVSEANAADSETRAADSETSAAASEAKAQQWADNPEDAEVETGLYSARHWAIKAGQVSGVGEHVAAPNPHPQYLLETYAEFVDSPITTTPALYMHGGNPYWSNRRIRSYIERGPITVDADSVTGSNRYYELGSFGFLSMEGELLIEAVVQGGGFGAGARWVVPLSYAMDFLSQYGLSTPTTDEWITITPAVEMNRHRLSGERSFELQAKPDRNNISFRFVVNAVTQAGGTANLYVKFTHSNDFDGCSYAELTGVGTPAGPTTYEMPYIATGRWGSAIFATDTTFHGTLTLGSVPGGTGDFLTRDGAGQVNFRTAAEARGDIGAEPAGSVSTHEGASDPHPQYVQETGQFSGSWDAIPAGTKMLFQQTSAPAGWTKNTTHNNKALRVVTGTAGSGGGNAFTTAFNSNRGSSSAGSHTHSITVGNRTLTSTSMPAHYHWEGGGHTILSNWGETSASSRSVYRPSGGEGGDSGVWRTESTGSSGSHNHAASSGSAGGHSHTLNLNVQYVDLIIATKD